jgi:hypothetical protein
MGEERERLRVALRVLAAVTDFREPAETDMQALRSYAPLFTRRPPDELACQVIQEVLRARGRFGNGISEEV